jgi:hypothetical protein
MHHIRLNQKQYKGPSRWSELDEIGLLNIAAISSLTRYKKYRPHYLVIKLFKLPVRTVWALKECQKIQLEECIAWMSEKNSIIRWLIARVSVRLRKYHGPTDKLGNITLEEFMFAEASYTQWLEDQQPESLNTLFAALYRRRVKGVTRADFTEEHKLAAEKAAAHIRPYLKLAMALNYAGCRNFIIDRHPNVWKITETNESAPLLTPPVLQKVNWAALALEQSGDKFGTYNQTIKMNLWLFLADMDKKALQAAKLKPTA